MPKAGKATKAAAGPVMEPRIPDELDAVDVAQVIGDLAWAQLRIAGDGAGRRIDGLVAAECRVEQASLTGMRLERARLRDMVFDGCDLSAVRFDEVSLTRVEFRRCRLSGAQFPSAAFSDVRLVGCKVDQANFRMVEFERVRFDDCVLRDADFLSAGMQGARLYDCDLTGADFQKAAARGIRLNGSTLDGLKGADALVGAVIDSAQLMPFAWAVMATLQVKVTDERAD